MKRISLLAMAVALVMTLAQCKKTETPTNGNEGGKVHITLDVNDGEKVIISPATGGTAFEQGDKVLVANGGHYVGTLTYDKSLRKFDGDLDEGLDEDDYLHFYLLGGNDNTEEDLNDATNRPTTLTVNISDQTAAYPEIAYAPSTVKYSSSVSAYKARLLNKCALVKFTTNSISTSKAVTITGMNNKVAVDLSDNSFEYSKVGDGAISLHAESETERWGILLPQNEVTNAKLSANGYVDSDEFTVGEIVENGYLDEGIAVTLVAAIPVGAINSKFTVASGKQVYFSQGNLQYFCSTSAPVWRFAEHQYDYVAFDGSAYSENSNKWIDLFGYGTSGYNNGQSCWQPYHTAGSGYYTSNLTGNADWGYNAISNGGNKTGVWRTLTIEEWRYLFQTRSNASSKCGSSSVNGINGLVILPDIWTLPDGLSFTPGIGNWHNSYTIEQWNQMESAGAIFLPAAGSRSGTDLPTPAQDNGFYRSSSQGGYYVFFNSDRLQTDAAYVQYGDCVRLVCDVENE